jgi:hypothetical protein
LKIAAGGADKEIRLRRNDRARLEPPFEAPIKLPAANLQRHLGR